MPCRASSSISPARGSPSRAASLHIAGAFTPSSQSLPSGSRDRPESHSLRHPLSPLQNNQARSSQGAPRSPGSISTRVRFRASHAGPASPPGGLFVRQGSRSLVGSSSTRAPGSQGQDRGQGQPLLLAAGETGGSPVLNRPSTRPAGDRVHAADHLLPVHPQVLGAEGHLQCNVGGEELGLEVLEDETDLAGQTRTGRLSRTF